MRQFKLHYQGSIFWLIFWVIFFFPIALALLFTACYFDIGETRYIFNYEGSRFWLAFWILVFFPIALVLLFVNGVSILEKKIIF